jgi:spoIIIJ-associated protein
MQTETQTQDPKQILTDILAHLGIEAQIEAHPLDGGGTLLHLQSAEAGRLIGKHGQMINSLQYLVNRILLHKNPDAGRVTLDVEHYRERQRDELVAKAKAAAEKVKRWGEPVELEPMSAFDRRMVHQALADDPEIETVSVETGKETGKKSVTIRLREHKKA